MQDIRCVTLKGAETHRLRTTALEGLEVHGKQTAKLGARSEQPTFIEEFTCENDVDPLT